MNFAKYHILITQRTPHYQLRAMALFLMFKV